MPSGTACAQCSSLPASWQLHVQVMLKLTTPPWATPSVYQAPPPAVPPRFQGTDYTSVCLEAERGTSMLLGASMDRAGGEWISCASLEVDMLLVGCLGGTPLALSGCLVGGEPAARRESDALLASGSARLSLRPLPWWEWVGNRPDHAAAAMTHAASRYYRAGSQGTLPHAAQRRQPHQGPELPGPGIAARLWRPAGRWGGRGTGTAGEGQGKQESGYCWGR